MTLASLPSDVLLIVADYLPWCRDINPLTQTCHRLHSILNRYLYRRNVRAEHGIGIVYSIRNAEAGAAKHFLVAGVDVNQEYPHGVPWSYSTRPWGPPLHAALINYRQEVQNQSKRNSQATPLSGQPLAKHHAMIRLLLDWGADVGSTRSEAIMKTAVEANCVSTVRLLISRDAHHGAKASEYSPLLQLATIKRNMEMVRLLLDEGFVQNATHPNGYTPLHSAASVGNEEAVRLMIQEGFNVNARDWFRRTPLSVLISSSKVSAQAEDSIRRLLLEHGADVFTRDQTGYTLVHMAVSAHRKMIPDLMRLGLEVNAVDNAGRTPFHLLRNLDRNLQDREMAKLLIQCGAKPHLKDGFGQPAIGDTQLLMGLVSEMGHKRASPKRGLRNTFSSSRRS